MKDSENPVQKSTLGIPRVQKLLTQNMN